MLVVETTFVAGPVTGVIRAVLVFNPLRSISP